MKLTLTPMDINNKEFKRVMRGYNPEEVDDFLDEIVENYESLYKENAALKDKLSVSSDKIEHYSKIESTIQNTLLLAQNAADQAKTSSEKEAEILIKNANETAQKILDKAHNDVVQINDEYEAVKQEFIKFRAKFRNFINTQLETFNDLERDVTKSFSISAPVEDEEEDYEVPKFEEKNNFSSDDFSREEKEYEEEQEGTVTFDEPVYEEPVEETNVTEEEVINDNIAPYASDTLEPAPEQEEQEEEVLKVEEPSVEEEQQPSSNQDTLVFDDDSIKAIEDNVSQDEIDEIRSFFASKE